MHILDGPSPDLPTEDEVSNSRWHYTPCPPKPAENPMPGNAFVHYLLYKHKVQQPARPGKKFRFHQLPKKLNDPLLRPTGDYVTAWGVHIIEGPDNPRIFWTMLCAILLFCAPLIAYTIWKRDIQGGSGLMAVVIAMLTLLYTMMKASEQGD